MSARLVVMLFGAMLPGWVQATQGCGAAEGWDMAAFEGEVYGRHGYETAVGPNRFVLTPTEFGWRIEVRDEAGADLAVFSPPLRPVDTNPRNIAGWHFRNRNNSGPNRGEINAPQTLRRFTFGALAADPRANPELVAPGASPADMQGFGELTIEDYGLADLSTGQRARMVYMKFRGCVQWDPDGFVPESQAAAAAAAPDAAPVQPAVPVAPEPGVPDRVVLRMTVCGLDAAVYRLSDRMAQGREGGQRPFLEPDLDGDGHNDIVAPVTRVVDEAPGLAICLASGSRLIMAGYSGRIGKHLDPVYFGRVDWWNVYPRGSVNRSAEGMPPVLTGDAILLGREDSSSVLLFLAGGVVSSYWQGD